MRKTFWLSIEDAVLVAEMLMDKDKREGLTAAEYTLLHKLTTWILRKTNGE